MDSSSRPSTRGLDGEAATDSTPVFSFTSATIPPITLSSLAPTQCPHPRPWQRIAVPGAGNKLGLRTVWKRIGGVPRSIGDTRYFKGVFELRADGSGSRKNRRTERHVPVFGDAEWTTSSEVESIEEALANARDAVASSATNAEVSDTNILGRSLAFVPRKRNSRRQPLTVSLPPPTEPAAAQSPVRATTTVDESLEAIEQSAEHITKRAKRRMSRRISLLPKLEGGSLLSPEKKAAPSHVFSSPVKRRVSMAAIHEPPATPGTPATPATARAMTAATPTSAKSTVSIAPPNAFEPTFSSPIKTLAPISENLSPAKAASPSRVKIAGPMSPVVVFDRPPVEEMQAEPAHEVQRRISLYNTRRRESTVFSSTVERQSPAKATATSRASRRHSFLPQNHSPLVFEATSTKKSTNRRHTFQPGGLGIMFNGSFDKTLPELGNIPGITVSESENTSSTIELSGLDESTVNEPAAGPTQDETVVVDVRTNLDIFGSGPPVQTHHSPTSEHHVSFDLKTHTEKPAKSTPTKSTKDGKDVAQTASPTPKSADLLDVPSQPENDDDTINDQSLDTVTEEDTVEVSNESTPRSLSPEMDIDITEEDSSREVTDEMGIVSSRRPTQLDESLLLPLPETTEPENEMETDAGSEMKGDDYGWQSPTSAELGHLRDALDTPRQEQEKSADVVVSPTLAAQVDIDMGLLVDENDEAEGGEITKDDEAADDIEEVEDQDIEDIEEVEEAEDNEPAEDVFVAPSVDDLLSDSPSPSPSVDEENGEYTVTQPINMFTGADEDVTTTMTMDFDNLADEDQLSAHEDSETEMLRKFVTRVKADKSAKAAAAAEAASARSLAKMQRKRRSGSTGSTASSSGSPMTKKEKESGAGSGNIFASPFTTLEARVPFGKKDHNMSPSPRKKRRALTNMDSSTERNENRTEDLLGKPSFDDNSPPRPKRRRKKMEADTGGIFNPEFMNAKKEEAAATGTDEAAPGPRRSKRTRSQTPLKSAATTANNAAGALSLIPVRLPGSLNLNGDDSYGLSTSSLSIRRNDEKDLAATTRVNTRKNKGNADPPCIVVARQSHEALRAMREQKSVFDSPLIPQKTSGRGKAGDKADSEDGKSRKTKKSSKPAKTVRWAEVLARFQTSDGESSSEKSVSPAEPANASADDEPVSKSSSSSRAADKMPALPLETEESEGTATASSSVSSAPLPASVPSAAAPPSQSADSEKTSIPRRTTRVSRLQPPTPRKVIASAAAAKAASAAPPPQPPAEPAPMGLKALPSGGASAKRMATRRAKIVGMGMAGNGTPAPKRRTTRTT